jgi:signal transduction histidine kinase
MTGLVVTIKKLKICVICEICGSNPMKKLGLMDGNAVFAIVVVAAYATIFTAGVPWTTGQIALLLTLGAAYLLAGIWGYDYCLRRGGRAWSLIYFPFQFAVGGAILYLSGAVGFSAFLLLPLPAQAVLTLPKWGAGLVAAATVAILTILVAGLSSWDMALNAGISFSAGVLFVMIFSYLTLREERTRKEVERLLAELQQANDKLRQYAAQVEELATAQERNRLAREIHDSLGHYLTVINVQLQAAQAVLDTDMARAKAAVQKAQILSQEGLTEVRHSVAALRTSPLENRTLPEALGELAAENRAAGIVTQLAVLGADRALSAPDKLTLYRAAQEGLTNVRKHARASRVDLTLDYRQPEQVQLAIQDNGVGATDMSAGFGLIGIRERVQLLQGSLELSTGHGQGFRLTATLPVKEID